jgi:very-short-patch-repair endonuclease
MGPFLSQAGFDGRLVAIAVAQHGPVSLAQLRATGLTESAVRKRAGAGRLHRIHCGVYALVPRELLTRNGLYMAAVLACGPGAVLSHRSAAALHELRPSGGARIDVTVPNRSYRRHTGIAVHRSPGLIEADTTRMNNIPCTTVARTLLDIAAVLDRRPLERVFDQAEILELFDLGALNGQLVRNPTRTGIRIIKAILTEHYLGSTPTWSELEEVFLALVRRARLPDPQVNAWIDPGDGDRPLRVDFAWRAERVAVETDGRRTHRTRQARERDPRRDQRLIAAGWRPVRTTWRQVMRRPQELQATLRALLPPAAPG